MPKRKPPAIWILLDGRAKTKDTYDRATVMDTATSRADAIRTAKGLWEGYDAIWEDPDGNLRWDLPPAKEAPQ
jgi:hypothetical protein